MGEEWGEGQGLLMVCFYPLLGWRSFYYFSCTPCRGAFGGKSTAKPPTRQRSHQTKNSYYSRITRHFAPQTNSAFVVYSFCLIVHFWLLSECWPSCRGLTFLISLFHINTQDFVNIHFLSFTANLYLTDFDYIRNISNTCISWTAHK